MIKYLLSFLLFATTVSGQVSKIYLTKSGQFSTSPKKASSYNLIQKVDDTTYMVANFNMKDTILSRGTYRDSLLTIPNGKFVYYSKKTIPINLKGVLHTDTNTFISSISYFANGAKTGRWVEFEKRAVKKCSYAYKDNMLNGTYERYDRLHNNYIIEEGIYINDKREGNWNLYGYDTLKTPVQTRVYKSDKLVSEITHIVPAECPEGMEKAFKKKLRNLDSLKYQQIKTTVTIDINGDIKNPRIDSAYKPEVNAVLWDLLRTLPKFKPERHDNIPKEATYTFSFALVHIYNRPDDGIVFILTKDVGNGMEFRKSHITL